MRGQSSRIPRLVIRDWLHDRIAPNLPIGHLVSQHDATQGRKLTRQPAVALIEPFPLPSPKG
jgi:hypothetical protein